MRFARTPHRRAYAPPDHSQGRAKLLEIFLGFFVRVVIVEKPRDFNVVTFAPKRVNPRFIVGTELAAIYEYQDIILRSPKRQLAPHPVPVPLHKGGSDARRPNESLHGSIRLSNPDGSMRNALATSEA
jgi:hypothetical protein